MHIFGLSDQNSGAGIFRSCIIFLILGVLLTGCAATATTVPELTPKIPSETPEVTPTESSLASSCPVTEPVWAKPPEDSAVQDPPAYGYYYVNEDRSIWSSAWWTESEEYQLRVSEEGVKVGWFRPAGAELVITGQRIDAEAPPLEAHASCCYPTRFQASGLYFPTEGCWEVSAKAADSTLSYVVFVAP